MTPRPGPCGCTGTVWCEQHWQVLPAVWKRAWIRRQRGARGTSRGRGLQCPGPGSSRRANASDDVRNP